MAFSNPLLCSCLLLKELHLITLTYLHLNHLFTLSSGYSVFSPLCTLLTQKLPIKLLRVQFAGKKGTSKMRKKALSFLLHQDITMMIPLILHHCNLLSPFDLLSLIMISILDIFCNAGETSVQPAVTRRRRTRKPRNCISNWFARKNHSLNQNGTCTEIRGAIDKFFVSTKEIAKGSNGTVVFEGMYQGRKVAVKRLVKNLNQVALEEVKHLIASDQHPNIVRMHGVKHDKEYVYLALERCVCSLSDLVSLLANSDQNLHESGNWVTCVPKHIYLWKNNGYPSALLLQLMRDMVKGLVHLHKRGIIHRDIKPQNIMISEGMDICAKLSEIGINKCLLSDKSSLTENATENNDNNTT